MITQLKDFLTRSTGPMYMDLLMSACNALYKIGVRSHETDIISLLAQTDKFGDDTSVIAIADILNERLDTVITEHGVVIESADLNIKVLIVEGLMTLQNYNDPTAIVNILESDNDATGIFAELMELVSGHPCTDFEVVLIDVSPSMLKLLQDLSEEEEGFHQQAQAALSSIIKDRIRLWIDKFPDCYAATLVSNGTKLGMPLITYTRDLPPALVTSIDKSETSAATELTGLVMLSDTPASGVRDAIHHLNDEFLSGIDFITRTDLIVDKYMTEVNSNGQA